jgi:hypothetical protein
MSARRAGSSSGGWGSEPAATAFKRQRLTDACRSFIDQLTLLVETMKSALPDEGLRKGEA